MKMTSIIRCIILAKHFIAENVNISGKKTSFLGNGTIMVSSEKYLCETVCIGKYL